MEFNYEKLYRDYLKNNKIKGSGTQFSALCPFTDNHNNGKDDKHSFSFNTIDGRCNCFAGCLTDEKGKGGNATKFLAKIKGITNKEAYKYLIENYSNNG